MKGNFYDNERVALFIDGANLYCRRACLGFDIDYSRLLEVFREKGRLVRAYYYTALVEDQEYSPIRPLIDWLDYNGFTMVTKPTKEFTDAKGRRKIKGNMDIELAVDMLEMADASRPCGAVLRRRRFPPPGRGRAAQGRAGHRGQHHQSSRRWWPTSCAARPTTSSSSADLAPLIARDPSERTPRPAVAAQRPTRPGRRVDDDAVRSADAVGLVHRSEAAQLDEPPPDCPLCPRLVAFRAEPRPRIPTGTTRPSARSATGRARC